MSTAWAFKAGEDADDTPTDLPEYADVGEYLADPDRHNYRNVKIGQYILQRFEVEDFHEANTLTDNNLIKAYADVAAYLADNERTNRLYADIGGQVYHVVRLEAYNNAGTLNDDNLPRAEMPRFRTTAVGDNARARGYDGTAVGESARALGDQSTAVGQNARAFEYRSTAIGDHARAHSDRTTAVGTGARAAGERAIALGNYAVAGGERSTALGSGALVAKDRPDSLGTLIDCALQPSSIDSFVSECNEFLTDAERADSRLAQDNADGEAFRQSIITRLEEEVGALAATRATAVGASAWAGAERATALGASSRATATRTTAVGYFANALRFRSTALGASAHASGAYSTAVGQAAGATGDGSIAVGQWAQGHGDVTVALGQGAGAGAWVTSHDRYADAAEYLADQDRSPVFLSVVIGGRVYAVADLEAVGPSLTDATLPAALAEASEVIAPWRYYVSVESYLNDPDRIENAQVLIAGKAYNVADLEAVENLDESSLPDPLKGASGSVAVGYGAQATAEKAVAFGREAHAVGANAVALGAGVSAGENEVVIGSTGHTYKLPGLAASQTENPEVLTVDGNGQLTVSALSTENAAGVRVDLGLPTDAADATGSAFARIASVKETAEATDSRVGTTDDMADVGGSAHARITHIKDTLLEAIDDPESAAAAAVIRADEAKDAVTPLTRAEIRQLVADSVQASIDEVVLDSQAGQSGRIRIDLPDGGRIVYSVKGDNMNEQFASLLATLGYQSTNQRITDGDGNPIGTTAREFKALDDNNTSGGPDDPDPFPLSGAERRLGYLFEALYGDPTDGVVYNQETDSDAPGSKSAFGRIESLEKGELKGTGYEEARPIGSDDSVPDTNAGRRVVVQDTMADGTVKLRTLDSRELFAVDQRVDALDKRLRKATAMSSALSALPNVVPDGGTFFLGAGVGHYSGEQAFAIGMSARYGTRSNVFLNAGVAIATGDGSASARIGAGFVWK